MKEVSAFLAYFSFHCSIYYAARFLRSIVVNDFEEYLMEQIISRQNKFVRIFK